MTVEELQELERDLYASIGHRFIHEYDPELYDGTMKNLVEKLDEVQKRIQEMSK